MNPVFFSPGFDNILLCSGFLVSHTLWLKKERNREHEVNSRSRQRCREMRQRGDRSREEREKKLLVRLPSLCKLHLVFLLQQLQIWFKLCIQLQNNSELFSCSTNNLALYLFFYCRSHICLRQALPSAQIFVCFLRPILLQDHMFFHPTKTVIIFKHTFGPLVSH